MSSGSNNRQRQILLGFRASYDEAEAIRAAASASGLSVAELCRQGALARAAGKRSVTDDALRSVLRGGDGPGICPRCAGGLPICTDGFSHAETCARYEWADDVCSDCEAQMAAEDAAEQRLGLDRP